MNGGGENQDVKKDVFFSSESSFLKRVVDGEAMHLFPLWACSLVGCPVTTRLTYWCVFTRKTSADRKEKL